MPTGISAVPPASGRRLRRRRSLAAKRAIVQRPTGRLSFFVGPQRGQTGRGARPKALTWSGLLKRCASWQTTRTTHGMTSTEHCTTHTPILFRTAEPRDGTPLWHLVNATGKLEANSAYAYVLLATDFGDTCLVAEQGGQLVGAVLGYHPPREPGTAFVWQVGVHPRQQGQGLGLRLLQTWLALPANVRIQWVTATVACDNPASQALFRRLASEQGTECTVTPHFTADLFPPGHPPEPLFRIGSLNCGTPARGLQGELEFPVPV